MQKCILWSFLAPDFADSLQIGLPRHLQDDAHSEIHPPIHQSMDSKFYSIKCIMKLEILQIGVFALLTKLDTVKARAF